MRGVMGVRTTPSGRIRWSRGTVADLFSGRDNSLGLLRLLLATAVVVAHARILGFGTHEFGYRLTGGQTDLGKISVFGFFVLSGMLITRSGNRLPFGRFLWHRALRLLPALWVCLTVTALVVAPFLYWRQQGGLTGFWHHADAPLHYIQANATIRPQQTLISGILERGMAKGHVYDLGFNGALWSLQYEVLCYLGVGLLVLAGARSGALTHARRAILLVTAFLGFCVLRFSLEDPLKGALTLRMHEGAIVTPIVGGFIYDWVCYLGFAFGIGMLIEVYKERIPVSAPLALLSALTMAATLRFGFFFVLGVPAFAYLLLWLAIRMPKPLRAVGRKHDYSYGIYIYGFVMEQAVATLGGARWGYVPYLALVLAATLTAAVLSWHLVERPALKLKDVGRRRSTPQSPAYGGPTPSPVGDHHVAHAGTSAP